MNEPGEQIPPTSDRKSIRDLNKAIGPYRLEQILGQGGMGTVYLARQVEPVRRRVAVKILNHGQTTPDLLARFEAECRALAVMDHPHIAGVYDSGVTDDGRPYLVMEWIKGEAIDDFCDHHRLGLRDRLVLMLRVCAAIQHAHSRFIIHRDIKPNNILVTLISGKPVPKIIDFGVAKNLIQPLVDSPALETQAGVPIGTPMYMSPEQIEGKVDQVDVRMDVYGLGALLYLLVCGRPPFEPGEDEYFRLMIRVLEDEPDIPHVRFTKLSPAERVTVARNRGLEPKPLERKLKGDLNWIILKALKKNRDSRYGSVIELKADIECYLDFLPVSARPPKLMYRFLKFTRRHKVAVASALMLLVVLSAGMTTTTMAMLRAKRAQQGAMEAESRAKMTVEYLRNVLASVDPNVDGRQVRVIDLLQKASRIMGHELEDQPEIEASVRKTIGWSFLELGLYDEAEPELRRSYQLQKTGLGQGHPETLNTVNALGRLLYKKGHYREAEQIHREVLEKETVIQGEDHPTTLWTMYNLAKSLDKQSKREEAEQLYRRNLELRRRVLGPDHAHTMVSVNSYSLLLGEMGRLDEAEELQRDNLDLLTQVLGPAHPTTLNGMANLAHVLNQSGKVREALTLNRQVSDKLIKILGADHPETLTAFGQMATSLMALDRHNEAKPLLEKVVLARDETLGSEHPDAIDAWVKLALTHHVAGEHEEARVILEKNVKVAQKVLPPKHWKTALYQGHYGRCLMALDQFNEAEYWLLEAYQVLKQEDYSEAAEVLESLVQLYNRWEKPEQVDRYKAMLEY